MRNSKFRIAIRNPERNVSMWDSLACFLRLWEETTITRGKNIIIYLFAARYSGINVYNLSQMN